MSDNRLMPAVDRVVTLLRSTPGVVSDRLLAANGCTDDHVNHARAQRGLTIVRIHNLGFRLDRNQ